MKCGMMSWILKMFHMKHKYNSSYLISDTVSFQISF